MIADMDMIATDEPEHGARDSYSDVYRACQRFLMEREIGYRDASERFRRLQESRKAAAEQFNATARAAEKRKSL